MRRLCSSGHTLVVQFLEVYEDLNDVHIIMGLCKGEQRGGQKGAGSTWMLALFAAYGWSQVLAGPAAWLHGVLGQEASLFGLP